jgi:hypothetical protein
MDRAAREYTKALENRDILRKRPPHDIFELQDKVKDISSRLQNSKARLTQAVASRYAPSKPQVTRPSTEGVYAVMGKILVKRGIDGPSLGFWDVEANKSYYLKKQGRNWVVTYANDDQTPVQLVEYWTPGGLRR